MKFFAVVALFAGLAVLAKAEEVSTGCARNKFGIFANPSDCSRYALCVSGVPIAITCPTGTGFDERVLTCTPHAKCLQVPKEEPKPVETDPKHEEEEEFKCPGYGIFADANNCDKYYFCARNKAYHLECFGGMKFDVVQGECRAETEKDLVCANQKAVEEEAKQVQDAEHFHCPKEYGYFTHPTDCTKFILCVCGVPNETRCPENTEWNQNAQVCDHISPKCFVESLEI